MVWLCCFQIRMPSSGSYRCCFHSSWCSWISGWNSGLHRIWDWWKSNNRISDNYTAWESKTGSGDSAGMEMRHPRNQKIWRSAGELQKVCWVRWETYRIPDYYDLQWPGTWRYHLQK
jgi:purA: adenylosuccinate synthetase